MACSSCLVSWQSLVARVKVGGSRGEVWEITELSVLGNIMAVTLLSFDWQGCTSTRRSLREREKILGPFLVWGYSITG